MLNFIPVEEIIIDQRPGQFIFNIHDRDQELSAFFPQKRKCFVGGYPVYPGEKLSFLFEPFQVLPYFYKGLLGNIVRIFVADHQPAHMPVHLFLILAYEEVEGIITRLRIAEAVQ